MRVFSMSLLALMVLASSAEAAKKRKRTSVRPAAGAAGVAAGVVAGAAVAASPSIAVPPSAPTVVAAKPEVNEFPPIRMAYEVETRGMTVGEGIISLEALGQPNCYRYSTVTKPTAVVRLVVGTPKQISTFCVVNGQIRPIRYEFNAPKVGEDSFTLDFDWQRKKVTGGVPLSVRDVPEGALEVNLIQQAVRLWVMRNLNNPKAGEFPATVINADDISQYRFAMTGKANLTIGDKTYPTITVERVDHPTKKMKFWISPEQNYMPIKVEDTRDGKPRFKLLWRG
jgi:hypothetical protein